MTDKDKLTGSSKLIPSFDPGTLDTGFGESTIPGHSPDFQTGQFGGLSDMIDPALDAEFAERTQTDLVMPHASMHDDETAEQMSGLLLDCLDVVDDFDKLLRSARDLEVDAKLIVELEMARKRLLGKLAGYEVEHRAADGDSVDVSFHEVIREVAVESDADHGKIIAVEREGYVQHGQPLRRAHVVVGEKA